MPFLTDSAENFLVDSLWRGGALNTSGAANSTSVVKGLWTASTVYAFGDIVIPVNNTNAGGKFLRCTTAGTSGSTFTSSLGNPSTTVADNTVTWTVVSGVPVPLNLYAGLVTVGGQRQNTTAYTVSSAAAGYVWLTANDGQVHIYKCTTAGTTAASQGTLYPGVIGEVITDGSAVFTEQTGALDVSALSALEASGGSYARVAIANTLANWCGTQSAGSTTASSGTSATTSNNNAITWATPSANWGCCAVVALFDAATGGTPWFWSVMTAPQVVSNGNAAPSTAAGAWQFKLDT